MKITKFLIKIIKARGEQIKDKIILKFENIAF